LGIQLINVPKWIVLSIRYLTIAIVKNGKILELKLIAKNVGKFFGKQWLLAPSGNPACQRRLHPSV